MSAAKSVGAQKSSWQKATMQAVCGCRQCIINWKCCNANRIVCHCSREGVGSTGALPPPQDPPTHTNHLVTMGVCINPWGLFAYPTLRG